MLRALHISNIAVIKSCDIEFSPGFNVLTGETGAGKSIVLDSIALLCHAKPAKDLLRAGADKAMVSAYFTDISDKNKQILSELGVECEEDGSLFVQRDISADGKSRSRINSRLVPLSLMRSALKSLVNIHGQHDNTSLTDTQNHPILLDLYIGDGIDTTGYCENYSELCRYRRLLEKTKTDEQQKLRMQDLFSYQLKEIKSAKLKIGEEEELNDRKLRIKNLEKINKNVSVIYRALYHNNSGASACSLIEMAQKAIQSLDTVFMQGEELYDRLENIHSELEDIAEAAEQLKDADLSDPEAALDIIENRLAKINSLKRKYGSTVEEILDFAEKTQAELNDIADSEANAEEYEKQIAFYTEQANKEAKRLSQIRHEYAEKLEKDIMSELSYLDMGKVVFKVDFKHVELSANGSEEISFLISTNPGDPPKPLERIASGGELARIMLALKIVFAKKEGTQTLIYDEIDTGISGKTAQKLGFKLKESAKFSQVICVTHSAQVASACENHIFIEKTQGKDSTETSVRTLSYDERIREIARIMGGSEITRQLLSSAEELISQADKI